MWNALSNAKAIAATALVGLALSAGTAWYGYSKGLQSGKSQIQTQWDKQKLETAQLHLEEIDALNKTTQAAIEDARQREAALRRAAAATGSTLYGLRQQLASANQRIATASNEAVAQYARTVNELLEECSRRYAEVAEKADGHASDAVLLHEAWPTNIERGSKP